MIRRAFEVGYLAEDEAETWLDSLDKRNLLSHTYDERMTQKALQFIAERDYPLLKSLHRRLKQEAEGS